MRKLNNKGYLLVEIIVASTLAIGIGYFLVRLTIKFSKQEEDIYHSLFYTSQKNVITSTIMDDLSTHEITSVSISTPKIIITYKDGTRAEINVDSSNNKLSFNNEEKWEFENNILIESISGTSCSGANKYCYIEIPIKDRYSDNNYDIRLTVKTVA